MKANEPQIKTVKATAPSYWATYLINGDFSGMEQSEIDACDAWIASLGMGDPVDCEYEGFMRGHDAFAFCPLAAECSTYTFLEP